MSRKNISEKETKALIANSDGVCAFPDWSATYSEKAPATGRPQPKYKFYM